MRRVALHSGGAVPWYVYTSAHEHAVELLVTELPMTEYERAAAQLVEDIVDTLAGLYRLPD